MKTAYKTNQQSDGPIFTSQVSEDRKGQKAHSKKEMAESIPNLGKEIHIQIQDDLSVPIKKTPKHPQHIKLPKVIYKERLLKAE